MGATDISRFSDEFLGNFNLATGAIGQKAAGTRQCHHVAEWMVSLFGDGYSGAKRRQQAFRFTRFIADSTVQPPAAYVGTGQTMYLWGAKVRPRPMRRATFRRRGERDAQRGCPLVS